MPLKIWSHNPGSHTAVELASRLRCRVLAEPGRSRWQPVPGAVIINYGNGEWNGNMQPGDAYRGLFHIINHPVYVQEFSNKLFCLNLLNALGENHQPRVITVPYTSNRDDALEMVRQGYDVVCRHKMNGHSGDGIEIVSYNQHRGNTYMPDCQLYTQYVKKSVEHRIHMFQNADLSVDFIWQQKRRRYECSTPDWAVRNYENGFIYAIDDVVKPANFEDIQQRLKRTVNLQFAAIDLITPNTTNTREVRNKGPMVLEVNTAPGLQSETLLNWYVDHFKRRVRAYA